MGELLDALNELDERAAAPEKPIDSFVDVAAQIFRAASRTDRSMRWSTSACTKVRCYATKRAATASAPISSARITTGSTTSTAS